MKTLLFVRLKSQWDSWICQCRDTCWAIYNCSHLLLWELLPVSSMDLWLEALCGQSLQGEKWFVFSFKLFSWGLQSHLYKGTVHALHLRCSMTHILRCPTPITPVILISIPNYLNSSKTFDQQINLNQQKKNLPWVWPVFA